MNDPRNLLLVGRKLFPITYGKTSDFNEALGLLADWMSGEGRRLPALCRWLSATLAKPCGPAQVLGAARWAGAGFPQVTLGHKLAASLCSTKIDPETANAARHPWPAYRILVPSGLVDVADPLVDGGVMPVDYLDVFDAGKFTHVTASSRSSDFTFFVAHGTLAKGLVEDRTSPEILTPLHDTGARLEDAHERALGSLWRLMVGVALEMSDPARVKAPKSSSAPADDARSGSEPAIATYVLGRTVMIDCRDALRAYLRGMRRDAPAVQSLVRGHWKRQAFGAKGADRRWIHVEPYWRGPEDAPIALRRHEVRRS
ncbi:MAG: hypothetical protein U0169_18375 [Polyangiaceae bacterium]